MLKKSFSFVLVSSLIFTLFGAAPVSAKSKAEKQAERVEKIKAGVAKLGVGREALITVKLRDKTKLSGYISRAEADFFVVTDAKTGASTEVNYPDVTQAKGQNLSTGASIAIGIAIGVGATLLVLFLIIISSYD
ncbi:MAG: hypothetical protein MOB07_27655 [Acidobacteria bacterium]|nr:hypothetical protein [Acidobacteriota bacterium]